MAQLKSPAPRRKRACQNQQKKALASPMAAEIRIRSRRLGGFSVIIRNPISCNMGQPSRGGVALTLRKQAQSGMLMLALLAAASMWFYVDRILVGYQVADAAARDRPRGNLSDLYPRWLGARELLLHQRNPYGDDITIEIQTGYYGRALDPARPNDPKDQQGVAYAVYVVVLLAPFVGFPFHSVQ